MLLECLEKKELFQQKNKMFLETLEKMWNMV